MAGVFKSILLIPAAIVALLLVGGPAGTWLYLRFSPSQAPATVLEKSEYIYRGYSGRETQYLRLKVRYQPSDIRAPETATIDVDENTFDQSRPGTKVDIAYIPSALLRQIPLYYTKRLLHPLPATDVPDVQRSAQATLKHVRLITTVGNGTRRRGLPAWQPFVVVEMRFIPERRDEPVTAVDSVDFGSLVNVRIGETVPVTYSLRYPRAAKIVGASRENEWKNALEFYGLLGVAALFLLFMFRRATRH